MQIIELVALDNGAHRNLVGPFSAVPDGWAIVPDGMTCENFPFGDVVAKEIDGLMTVTMWTAREIPESPEVAVEPTKAEPTEMERLRADVDYIAIMTGVELV